MEGIELLNHAIVTVASYKGLMTSISTFMYGETSSYDEVTNFLNIQN